MKKVKSGFTLMELVLVLGIITIMSAGVFMSIQYNSNRALENASLALQADIRYVQRRSIAEGRRYGIVFDIPSNRYRIVCGSSRQTIRSVYLRDGVYLLSTNFVNPRNSLSPGVDFLPRGTVSPQAGQVTLTNFRFSQDVIINVSGGRARISEIRRA